MISRSIGAAGALGSLAAAFVIAVAAPGSSAQAALDGSALFKQRCQGCHVVDPGKPGLIAPSLSGVVGRKAGAADYRYSDALKASKLVWTKANLDTFLAGPQQMVPGTRMIIKVTDPAERAAIVTYLSTAGR